VNRLWIFVLLSLLFHAVFIVSMSRFSLRVPETPRAGPLEVRLVFAVESENIERTGEREKEERGGIPEGQDQENNETAKEAAEPAKNRNRSETVLPGGNPSKPLKPQKREGLAETEKPREAAKDGASKETLKQGETPVQARAATGPREIPAEKAARNVAGVGKTELEGGETSPIGRENTEAGQSLQSSVPLLITDDLVVKKIMPVYPLIARRRGQEGRVLLRVALSADGSVENIMVEESSGFDPLDKSALQAVNHWLFSRDAPKTVLVPVTFRLQ